MRCYRTASDKPRAIKGKHADDCPARPTYDTKGRLQAVDPCDGCEPCGERHCGVCGWRHVDQLTCARCVGEVRESITAIQTLTARALYDALAKGVQSTAAAIIGPAAAVDRWQRRHRLVINAAVAE